MESFVRQSRLNGLEQQQSDRECFVVFLDIMGFKDRVMRTDHVELRDKLKELKQEIAFLENDDLASGSLLVQFSDSIILFSKDGSVDSLHKVAELACKILRTAIKKSFPIKGAMAKGMVTCDTSKQLYFGRPIIDAYLLEENVKYYGLVVHHTAEEDVKASDNTELFRDCKVYLRSGQINHYELLWFKANGELDETVIDDLNNIRKTVSDEPRKYIDNTLCMMKFRDVYPDR